MSNGKDQCAKLWDTRKMCSSMQSVNRHFSYNWDYRLIVSFDISLAENDGVSWTWQVAQTPLGYIDNDLPGPSSSNYIDSMLFLTSSYDWMQVHLHRHAVRCGH